MLAAVTPKPRWHAYFIFAPEGGLAPRHRYTLDRLRGLSGGLLVVYASPEVASIPPELEDNCDALYWKALGGFDFSAYALALKAVAHQSPGADLFLMNDSVVGPLDDLEPTLTGAAWDLTGFTATYLLENHLQSYAFILKNVTSERIMAFGAAIPKRWAYDRYRDVVNLQETRFARFAARHMSVGSLWYAGPSAPYNPTLSLAPDLVEAGFPFVKRSLVDRLDRLEDGHRLTTLLAAAGHPL
jgi:lipopolysaccharide biosynthesis protein